jgi:WD40 repeat protein/tRNA A-37 threonylcarbamoyl transferase component Bud32
MRKAFTCPQGHRWEVPLDGPGGVALELISCPECGDAAQTLPPGPAADAVSPSGAPTVVPLDTHAPPRPSPSPAPAPEPPALAVPESLRSHPRYCILEALGTGGMGAVYKAEHRVMNRVVALKAIRSELLRDPQAIERFQREAQAAARLCHPNIVLAHDAEQVGGLHILVMEFVQGQSLAEVVRREGPLLVARACALVRQAALGLQHAHERGMAHRDIKPHNLMLTPDGVVKILDFGLARFVSESGSEAALTQSGTLMGTADYIAPEQTLDARQADIRADIYSLGCTLYFLLTGQPPFPGGSLGQKLLRHQQAEPITVQQLRAGVPGELARVLGKMLAKRPQDRYQTPAEVAEALAPFLAPALPLRGRRGRRVLLGLGGVLAAVLVALGVIYITTDNGELEIRTHDNDVKVAVLRGGQEVEILDLRTRQKVRLRSGKYELKLVGERGDLTLTTTSFVLRRGDRVIAEVRRVADFPARRRPAAGKAQDTEPQEVTTARVLNDHRDVVLRVAVSPDGRQIASAGGTRSDLVRGKGDYDIRIWSVATGRRVAVLRGHTNSIQGLAFTLDDRQLASSGTDGTLRLWDLAKRNVVRQAHAGHVFALDASKDKVITVSSPPSMRLWQLPDLAELSVGPRPNDVLFYTAFSPDGRLAVAGGGMMEWGTRKPRPGCDHQLWLWDVRTGAALAQFPGHLLTVQGVAFTPDGKRIVSCSSDETLRIWDVAARKEQNRRISINGDPQSLALSPDGRRVACGLMDTTIRVWDLQTRRQLYILRGHSRRAAGLAFFPNGRRLVSASDDHTVRIWDLPD